jgi:hypothetical protein
MMTCGVFFPASLAERVTDCESTTQVYAAFIAGHHPQLLVIALWRAINPSQT